MYAQGRFAGDAKELLYFRHAPPILARLVYLTDYPDKHPKLPYKGAKGWHCSVYYFWWAFLKENADFRSGRYRGTNTPEGRVAEDFREVGTMNFPNWWLSFGRYLFAEPKGEGIRLEVPPVDPDALRGRVLLSVPFNGDLDRTLSEIRNLLSATFKSQGLTVAPSRAAYPVSLTTPLHALYRRYQVWCARRDHPEKTLHEIGLIAGLIPSGPLESFDVRRSFTATVSRYFKEASCIVEHVGRGLFPVMNLTQLELAQGALDMDADTDAENTFQARTEPEEMLDWINHVYRDDPELAARYRTEILPLLRCGLSS